MRLRYHSIVKYFSALSLPIRWINTPNNLPPSNAGIGKTLNSANANDIIPPNAKNAIHPHDWRSISPNFTAQTGPVSLSSDPLILSPLKLSKFFPSVHNALNVSSACAPISLQPAAMLCGKGNLIGWISTVLAPSNTTPSIQLSSGHVVVVVIVSSPR